MLCKTGKTSSNFYPLFLKVILGDPIRPPIWRVKFFLSETCSEFIFRKSQWIPVFKSYRFFIDIRKSERGVNFTPPARDRVNIYMRCFWKDPGLFFMKIQTDTVDNCTNSLKWPLFGENWKNALKTTWPYQTAHAQNKVVLPSNINITLQKVFKNFSTLTSYTTSWFSLPTI